MSRLIDFLWPNIKFMNFPSTSYPLERLGRSEFHMKMLSEGRRGRRLAYMMSFRPHVRLVQWRITRGRPLAGQPNLINLPASTILLHLHLYQQQLCSKIRHARPTDGPPPQLLCAPTLRPSIRGGETEKIMYILLSEGT